MAIDLVLRAVDTVLDGIEDGTFPVGQALPRETELATFLGVSRPTMREAVKILAARGVVRVQHGRGTFVEPQSNWTDLATLVAARSLGHSPRSVGLQLVEVRRMIEVGAAGLAAVHRTDHDIASMRQILDEFDRAHATNDIATAGRCDLEFHDAILGASGNPFVALVLRPIKEELKDSRLQTSADPKIRIRAQRHHRAILTAITSGDAAAAKDAMRAHMTQTREDIQRYLADDA